MIKKLFFLNIFFLFAFGQIFAQYQADALLYSQQHYGSTSKSMAMGGALSAVGADLSVMSVNPAGLGLFRSGHLVFSSNFIIDNTEARFSGNTRNENRFGYTVNNIGYVWAKRNKKSAWRNISFGIAYNRMGEYRQDIVASGINNTGSILDYYVYNANHKNRYSIFREELAYNAYLLEYDTVNAEYYSFVTDEKKYGERQRRSQSSTGGKGEVDLSFAMNYNDLINFGATIGTQVFNHERRFRFKESDYNEILRMKDTEEVRVDPKNMEYDETLQASGLGINVKAGVLITPTPYFRISAAVHSQTLTSFNEEYKTGISSSFYTPDDNNNYDYYQSSDDNFFTWNLHQPMRFNVGAAFVLDQYKLGSFYTIPMTFSFEYEFVDYSKMHLKSVDADFDKENDLIRDLYRETHNLRAGMELNFGKIRLRGGYAIYPDAFASSSGLLENAKMVYSGGISFAGRAGYIDISYSIAKSPMKMYMYDANLNFPNDPIGNIKEPIADITRTFQYITLTFGI